MPREGSEPPKKRRKQVKGFNLKELKGLENAEKSSLVSDVLESWQDKELWILQLPKKVSWG